ncbi:MAG: hypothetical protein SV765_01045 [Pseudomonadota bacterium]|nr:hypothetical protein [Pseudomonadota bacterium]
MHPLRPRPIRHCFTGAALALTALLSPVTQAAAAGITDSGTAPSLTIYNGNFAVVRDLVTMQLTKGSNRIRYQDITKQLEPDSVVLRPTVGNWPLRVLEQNYLSRPVNQQLLLEHFEGQTIDFEIQRNQQTSTVPGKIIRSGRSAGSPIIQLEGKTRFGLPGQPLFPALQDDTLLKPTLAWQLESGKPGQLTVELAYLTGGLSWNADYNVVAQAGSNKVDLSGWVTFDNQSGKNFSAAKVKLMAGDIHKISPRNSFAGVNSRMLMEADRSPQVQQRDFDDYHLYEIGRPVDLADGESKQIAFVSASGVRAVTRYVYDGAQLNHNYQANMQRFRNDANFGTQSNDQVRIYRQFDNTKANGLGVPLPQGRLRFYQQDKDQQLEFLGENNIDHTPKKETVSVYTGDAFDVKGERVRTDFEVNTRGNEARESFTITLTNRKSSPVTVTVVEHLYRWTNWELEQASERYKKLDAQTVEFELQVPADGTHSLSYRVQYRW